MTGFAASPGIEVEPLWSTRSASVPSAVRRRRRLLFERVRPTRIVGNDFDPVHGIKPTWAV